MSAAVAVPEIRWVAGGNDPLGFAIGHSHIVTGQDDWMGEKGALPLVACGAISWGFCWTQSPRPPTTKICKLCESKYAKFKDLWMTNQTAHEVVFQCGGCDIIRTTFRDGSRRWGIAPHGKNGKGNVIVGIARQINGKLDGPYNTTKIRQAWRTAVAAWAEYCSSGRAG